MGKTYLNFDAWVEALLIREKISPLQTLYSEVLNGEKYNITVRQFVEWAKRERSNDMFQARCAYFLTQEDGREQLLDYWKYTIRQVSRVFGLEEFITVDTKVANYE